MTKPLPHFGALISAWLYRQSLSPRRAATILGVTDQTVRNWIRGKSLPWPHQAKALAMGMELPVADVQRAIARSIVQRAIARSIVQRARAYPE